jgi:hypothetical protein
MAAMSGCNELVFDHENADSNASIAATYGSELAGNFGMKECGKPVVRAGKCEQHKVDRRKGNWNSDRRRPGSTDTPPSCGNGLCHSEIWNGEIVTRHDLRCPDRGPGWV